MGLSVIVLVALVGGLIYLVGVYNGLVSKRIGTDNAWSQIDVQLKRRHDLIPNLVETVKGYAGHEKGTLEAVIQARNSAVSAAGNHDVPAQIQAEGALSGTLKQLFALSEAYPDLKANENFKTLQEELSSTENRIGFARQHYNDSVQSYNTAVQTVPGNLVAGFGQFPIRQFFTLDPSEAAAVQQVPKVSF